MAVLEPVTQRFIDAIEAQGGKPLSALSYSDARQVLEDLQAAPADILPAAIEDRDLPAGPGGSVSVRIYRPEGAQGELPAVMYFHGGGWILGSKNTHDRLLRELANGAQAAFVFVNYTPAADAQFPVSLEQAYAATEYIAAHGCELGLDGHNLAVAGDSVGGNMAAAVTLLARERRRPVIRYQVLFYPVTDANLNTGSYLEFADGPWLTRSSMEWMWNAYAPNAADRKKPTASPLRASLEQLSGLPPALVITDENDVLRDEGEAYARKLIEAGVEVTSVRFLATFHDFAMLNGLAHTPAARSAVGLATQKLREAFRR